MISNLTFSKAFAELEKLVEQIEDDKIQIDSLADKIKQANELIRFCETKLRNVETDIKNASEVANKRKK